MRKFSFIYLSIALNLVLCLCFSQGSKASDALQFDINSDDEMDKRYDWVIDCKVSETNYLDYKESKLKPITKILVLYRINPRFVGPDSKHKKYEEFWFSQGDCIGCRRIANLEITATHQGAIRIWPAPNSDDKTKCIAGALSRLALEIALKSCTLSAVFIPLEIFDDMPVLLSNYRFTPNGTVDFNNPLALRLYSNPINKFANLAFSQ